MAKFQSQTHAAALLDQIQAYWAERGYDVRGCIVEGEYSELLRSKSFSVLTDLVNGLPKDFNRQAA